MHCCASGCRCHAYEQFLHGEPGECVCGHREMLHGPVRRGDRPRTPKYVFLRPTLGLCNRLRAVASAVLFIEDLVAVSGLECQLVLDWQRTAACGCEFADLFDVTASGITLAEELPDVESIAAAATLDALEDSAGKSGDRAEKDTALRYGRAVRLAGLVRKIGDGSHGLLRTDGRVGGYDDPYLSYECLFLEAMTFFYPRGAEQLGGGGSGNTVEEPGLRALEEARSACLRTLVPTAAISARVVRPETGRRSLAVHVRRSDNHFALMHSPLELFHREVASRATPDEMLYVFLSTDDPAVEVAFNERWAGAVDVVTAPRRTAMDGIANRGSTVGLQDALVDLLSLGQCDEILGSFWSSFSRVAALWRDRPLVVVFRPYRDVDEADKHKAAYAFGLLERGPNEEPDLEVNKAMMKITSRILQEDARCDEPEDDPSVIKGLLKALQRAGEKTQNAKRLSKIA